MSEDKKKFAPPQAPPQPPNAADYIRHFDRPLTKEEKIAWLGEVSYLVLNGIIPQSIYPELRAKIESLPEIDPSASRQDEKLPGSDYVHPGPPKGLKATTSYFDDAESMAVFEKIIKEKRQKKITATIITGSSITLILVFVLYIIYLGLKPGGKLTGESTPDNIPAYSVTETKDTPVGPREITPQPVEISHTQSSDSRNFFTEEMLSKLKHPQEVPIVRLTLELDEKYNGVFRVERRLSSDPPDDLFRGERFIHSAFPNALNFRGEKGEGRYIWGFNDSLEASWNRYHGACGSIRSPVKTEDGSLYVNGNTDIWFHNLVLPYRVCCDFPDVTNGQPELFCGGAINEQGDYGMLWFFVRRFGPDSYTIGYVSNGKVDVESNNQVNQGVTDNDEKLNTPFERKFKIVSKITGVGAGLKVTQHPGPHRIMRVDVAASRIKSWTGMTLTTKDDRLAIDKVTEKCAAWRVGLQDGDIIERINGKEYDEADAKELLKGAPFGTEYVLNVLRNGEQNTYTVHVE